MNNTQEMKYHINKYAPKCLYPFLIQHQYYKCMGKKCDLRNPVTYNEKMQWCKLNRNNSALADMANKITVRDYVKSIIGEEYLIPMLGGPYQNANEINFDILPKSFVIKANHGCGYNLIVKDKRDIDYKCIIDMANSWLKHNYAYYAFEMQYEKIRPQLYIEENLLKENMSDLPDYKFFCFDGKVFCSYTMIDYAINHSKGQVGFFDRDYVLLPYHRTDFGAISEQIAKPEKYEEMIEVAEALSKGFSHVRVDLYNVDSKIYFGEMTFTNCGGFCKFIPEEFDRILGELWNYNVGI